jgi:hypothetical protein
VAPALEKHISWRRISLSNPACNLNTPYSNYRMLKSKNPEKKRVLFTLLKLVSVNRELKENRQMVREF